MSLCGPVPKLDITLTQFQDGSIAYQFAAHGHEAAPRDIAKVLAAVLRGLTVNGNTPAPFIQPLFQETPQ